MNTLDYSFIIPVYNRPNEIDELLESFTKQDFSDAYEIIIVEDGSDNSSEGIVEKYASDFNIKYYYKENSGAGMSRNFGMEKATGVSPHITERGCFHHHDGRIEFDV